MDRPHKVIVIRHAEKPEDINDPGLSEAGKARAKRLRVFALETYGSPDVIYAAADSERSKRPRKTVVPLAKLLEQEVHTPFENKDVAKMAQHALEHADHAGKSVLICWHHGEIPALLEGLGVVNPHALRPWPAEDFSSQYEIIYSEGVAPMAFQRHFVMK